MLLPFFVCVDDLLLIGNNENFLSTFKDVIVAKFSLKDLGSLGQFLDVEPIPTSGGIFLS